MTMEPCKLVQTLKCLLKEVIVKTIPKSHLKALIVRVILDVPYHDVKVVDRSVETNE